MYDEDFMQSVRDHAVAYAASGFYVFPIAYGTKVPPKDYPWRRRASTDIDAVQKMFADERNRNIGIATGKESRLLVLDVDPRNGGTESYQKLYADMQLQPSNLGPIVDTPSGGFHVYFFEKRAVRSGPLNKKDYPGIDIKADGGYVVAAPSVILGDGGMRAYAIREID